VIIGIGMNILEGPNLDTSSYVAKYRTDEIDDCVWNAFLIEFYKKLKESIEFSIQSELSKEDCQNLLTALNKNPMLKEKYTQVLPNGSLKLGSQTLKWSSL
jgi:hypothetical protein